MNRSLGPLGTPIRLFGSAHHNRWLLHPVTDHITVVNTEDKPMKGSANTVEVDGRSTREVTITARRNEAGSIQDDLPEELRHRRDHILPTYCATPESQRRDWPRPRPPAEPDARGAPANPANRKKRSTGRPSRERAT